MPLFRTSSDEADATDLDPINYNEKKRQLLGNEIHEAFMHPKKFKIGKIELKTEPAKLKPLSKTKTGSSNEHETKRKHKFQLS